MFAYPTWPKEAESGMIRTANRFGSMFTELSYASQAFIDFAKGCRLPIMDIGCAYGVATLPALASSLCDVIAIDPSATHLDILMQNAELSDRRRLTCWEKYFPEEITREAHSISAIHLSNVLHFLTGERVLQGLKRCYQWLHVGGKIFINVVSIHHYIFKNFLPEYNARCEANVLWPGETSNLDQYETAAHQSIIPVDHFIHAFELERLKTVMEGIGFSIEYAAYYDLKSTIESPTRRGNIAIIAKK